MASPKPFRLVCPFCFSQLTVSMTNISTEVKGARRIIQHMKHHQKLFQHAANKIGKEIPKVRWKLAKARASLRHADLMQ